MMSTQKRVFIAINLPQAVKQALADVALEIRDSFPDEAGEQVCKWVKPENLHITLVFLGNMSQKKIRDLERSLAETVAGWGLFSLQIERVCYGPGRRLPPQLIWAESKTPHQLEKLVAGIKNQLLKDQVIRQVDKRPFKSHITLARVRQWQWRKINPEDQPDIKKELNLRFKVKSIDVMESKLKRSGPEYYLLSRIKL